MNIVTALVSLLGPVLLDFLRRHGILTKLEAHAAAADAAGLPVGAAPAELKDQITKWLNDFAASINRPIIRAAVRLIIGQLGPLVDLVWDRLFPPPADASVSFKAAPALAVVDEQAAIIAALEAELSLPI